MLVIVVLFVVGVVVVVVAVVVVLVLGVVVTEVVLVAIIVQMWTTNVAAKPRRCRLDAHVCPAVGPSAAAHVHETTFE